MPPHRAAGRPALKAVLEAAEANAAGRTPPPFTGVQASDPVKGTAVLPKIPHSNCCERVPNRPLQPFSQKSLTATVPKVFQIGLCGVVEADLELFWNSWSVGFLGERLYDPAEADLEHFWNCCSEGFLGERLYAIGRCKCFVVTMVRVPKMRHARFLED